MKIRNDFSYINGTGINNDLEDLGVHSFRFTVKDEKNSERIMNLLEENFKVYQYKNSTRERYDEHELFFWSNAGTTGKFTYFTIGFNNKSILSNYKSMDKMLMLLIGRFLELDFELCIQYTSVFNTEKIINYIKNCKLDINEINIKYLSIIENNFYDNHKIKLPVEVKNKLNELSIYIKNSLEGKRIQFNGMIGTVKKVNDNEYGFFKLRAKTRYYRFELRNIVDISF